MVFPKLKGQKSSKKDQDILRGAELLQEEINRSLVKSNNNGKTIETWDISHFDDDDSFDEMMYDGGVISRISPSPKASPGRDSQSVFSYPGYEAEYDEIPSPPSSPPRTDTPITHMGRDGKMKTKMVTYMVRADDDYDTEDDSDADVFTIEGDGVPVKAPPTPSAFLRGMEELDRLCNPCPSTYIPSKYGNTSPRDVSRFQATREEQRQGPPAVSSVRKRILKEPTEPLDPAWLHAQRAGHLWQSMVGQHVRFPKEWFNGARAPALGGSPHQWQYYSRIRIASNSILKAEIKNRSAPGRLLLHIIVLDVITCKPQLDIAVGCYHPNARGIRETESPLPYNDGYREIWWASRRRENGVSAVENFLGQESSPKGPLGERRRVSNSNVRAVFGEEPPMETLFVSESELYDRLSKCGPLKVMTLLEDYCFS